MITNKKGFSGILMLAILGGMFIAITAVITVQNTGENDAAIDLARSQVSGSRLTFIAQCMQADFYNNLLQTNLEKDVISFLMLQEHVIDPERSFKENLGSELESFMSASASGIVVGDAGQVYAAAYSTIPHISCTPTEVSGASASVSIKERADGILELSSWSLGQRVACEDSEAESKLTIDLQARDYQLQTRAIALHDRAVAEIKSIRDLLDNTEGVARISSGWRKPDDASAQAMVLTGVMGWNNQVGGVIALRDVSDSNGIISDPGDYSVLKSTDGSGYSATDMQFVCYGNVAPYSVSSQNGGQTCRPDGMTLVIKKKEPTTGTSDYEVPEENVVKLDFNSQAATGGKMAVSMLNGAVEITVDLPEVFANVVLEILDEIFGKSLDTGYVTYTGNTRLCNRFWGKPSSAVIRGTVTETNDEFIPGGLADEIPFRFISTSQSIDTSQIVDNGDCSDDNGKKVIANNVLLLLTEGGTKEFEIKIINEKGKEPSISQQSIDELANRVLGNPLYNVPGEGNTITISASIYGQTTVPVSRTLSHAQVDAGTAGTVASLGTGTSGSGSNSLRSAITQLTDPLSRSTQVVVSLEDASATLSSLGFTEDAEAVSRTAASVCKMMGIQSYMDDGDYGKALLAVCGLARLSDSEGADNICNIAGLYRAIESGSVQAVVSALNSMDVLSDGVVTAGTIALAVQSGDAEAVLEAAASAAYRAGREDLMRLYSGAAAVIRGVENGEVLTALSGFFGLIGDQEMANFFGSAASLQQALESGDELAAIKGIANMASSLGYSGLSTLVGQAEAAVGILHTIANLDEALDACLDSKSSFDLLCMMPSSGGQHLVCRDPHPINKCKLAWAAPSYNIDALCDALITDMGIKIDCTCGYACPSGTYPELQSVSLNIEQILMQLDNGQYANIIKAVQIAGIINAIAGGDVDLGEFCSLDP